MRSILAAVLVLAGAILGSQSRADGAAPVLVELYTSQGCSSCPPADALLSELADSEDVVALALHVDYWDYIGWKDSFARPEFTARQKAYASAAGHRTIYTPQMIVGGTKHVVGNKPMLLADLIMRNREAAPKVALAVQRAGESLTVRAEALVTPLPEEMVVQLVRYRDAETVAIARGENAGKTITYTNIVTDWQQVARWDGQAPLDLALPLPGAEAAVVLVQAAGPGEVLAVARAR